MTVGNHAESCSKDIGMSALKRTIIIDNDEISREIILFFAGTIERLDVVGAFHNPGNAIKYMRKNPVDLAILDLQMPEIDSIELGWKLHEINPALMLIYATTEKVEIRDEQCLKVAVYLPKPFSHEGLLHAVKSAELLAKRNQKHIYARTFGYFDLFVDGEPVIFKSAKAKELLAFLIDRQGGTVTTDQIITVLWEDRPNDEATQSLCSKIVKTLKRELDEYKIGSILIQKRGIRSIDMRQVDCDMYELMEGSIEAKERFFGDYMLEYSWAEERIHSLWERAQRISGRDS